MTFNKGGAQGGGLYIAGAATLISSPSFSSNSATDGGAIYVALTGSLDGSNVTMQENSASTGGAIGTAGTVTLTSSLFFSNTASSVNGGAIQQDKGAASVTGGCFAFNSNTAVNYGAGNKIDATGNWWRAANGPSGFGSGSGDSVSDQVDYSGFLASAPGGCPVAFIPTLRLTAAPSILTANGVSTSLVLITVSDSLGGPGIANQPITLTSSLGGLSGPLTPTLVVTSDVNGKATAAYYVRSTPGIAHITATWSSGAGVIQQVIPLTITQLTTGLSGAISKIFGAIITYTWTITNLGPGVATNVYITGHIPLNTQFMSALGGLYNGTDVLASLPSLPVGASFSIQYSVLPILHLGNILETASASSDNSSINAFTEDTLYRAYFMMTLKQ